MLINLKWQEKEKEEEEKPQEQQKQYQDLQELDYNSQLEESQDILNKENIPKYIEEVKNKQKVLFGFGHRVYKSYDPRAKIVRTLADDVFSVMGKEPMIEIAMELERIALTDDYFIKRNLYPNVDFYSGIIYKAMGFPTDMFPVLFSIPRVAGWLAHW